MATPAQDLHDRALQRTSEALQAFETKFTKAERLHTALNEGSTPEQREHFREALAEAKELRSDAAELKNISDSLDGFGASKREALGAADRPLYNTGAASDGAVLEASGSDQATVYVTQRSRRAKPTLLEGQARDLACEYLTPVKLGGRRLAQMDDAEVKLMSSYVDESGGLFTAHQMSDEVISHQRDELFVRSKARVIPITSAGISFPSAKIDVLLKKSREGRGTGQAPKTLSKILGKKSFTPYESSEIVKIPVGFLEDSTFDVVGWLAEEIAGNELEREERQFIVGTGSGEALGMLPALEKLDAAGYPDLGHPHSGVSGGLVTPEDIKRMKYKLRKVYRRNASWTLHREMMEHITVLRTESGGENTATGDFFFREGLSAGDPDILVGHAITESEYYPLNFSAGAVDSPVILLGDWRHYWIIDRKSLEIQILNELYAETREVGYQYVKRMDGGPIRPDSQVYYKRKA